ncbi:MAG: N-acetylmuramic acid 6-phosphate etherase, partial [Chitinophagaceae bacterium]|nr:N-acetylmuramic acid 6-phosphate etherase [Chitinophagaceae bacterium]
MASFTKITEQPSPYRHLEAMPVSEILTHINNEDKTVPYAIEKAIPQIEKLVLAAVDKMLAGG